MSDAGHGGPSMRPGRVRGRVLPAAVLVPLALLVGACAARPPRTFVEGAAVEAPARTVAVAVTGDARGCAGGSRCAERDAVRAVLFTGIPGSAVPRPMVRDEAGALRDHAAFFRMLLEEDGHQRYVVRVTEREPAAGAPRGSKSWIVVVNHTALRETLEAERVVRRFGY